MDYRLFVFVGILILFLGSILAADDFDYESELEKFTKEGILSEAVMNNVDALSDDQRGRIITEIKAFSSDKRNTFFNSWEEMTGLARNNFWSKMNSDMQKDFLISYSAEKGVTFSGLDSSILWGSNGMIGNDLLFFDPKNIEAYNQKNPNNPILSVEYKKDNGKTSLVFTKKDSMIEMITNEESPGFYFDAESGKVYGLKKAKNGESVVDISDPLTGEWNGKGKLTLDRSGDEPSLTLDPNKDGWMDSVLGWLGVETPTEIPSFKNSKNELYSALDKKVAETDEEGNVEEKMKKGEVVFNEDGKPKKLSFIHTENEKFNGDFGEDVDLMYNSKVYESLTSEQQKKLGSYLIIDEENKEVRGDLKRAKLGGVAFENIEPTAESLVNAFSEYKDTFTKKIEDYKNIFEKKLGDSSMGLLKEISKEMGILGSSSMIAATLAKNILDKVTSKDTLMKYPKMLSALSNNEVLVNGVLGAQSMLDVFKKNPVLLTPITSEGNFMDIQLKNGLIRDVERMDIRGGRVSIEDNNGNFVPLIEMATPMNYVFSPITDKQVVQFQGIDFVLENHNVENQEIRVSSNPSGGLDIKGVDGFGNLVSLGSERFDINARPNLGPRGNIGKGGRLDMTFPGVSVDLDISSEAKNKALTTLGERRREFDTLHSTFLSDGVIDESERRRLSAFEFDATVDYYREVADGDLKIGITSLGSLNSGGLIGREAKSVTNQEIDIAIADLSSNLHNFGTQSQTQGSLPSEIINVLAKQVYNNQGLQDDLAQRRLVSVAAIEDLSRKQIGEVATFLDSSSGSSFSVVKDSKNKIYQVTRGSDVMTLDPVVGEVTTGLLPIFLGSAKKSREGDFLIGSVLSTDMHFSGDARHEVDVVARSRIIGILRNVRNPNSQLRESVRSQGTSGITNYLIPTVQ